MASACRIRVAISDELFERDALLSELEKGSTDIGAVASFTGLCRSEGDSLAALELEHYPGMADRQIERVVHQAAERWPLFALTVVHRHGVIAVGEPIVFVGASSRHRDAAFDAARFVMDFLKTDAPFWKKEHRGDGVDGGWVDARDADDAARKRWE